jgi:recombination protein RecA
MASRKKPESVLSKIRKDLGHVELEWSPEVFLDTGIPDLNQVFGHPEQGIPYGRPIEIAGRESAGKSAIAWALAGIAQQQGAFVIWVDFENAYTRSWTEQRGVDPDKNFLVFQTYEGQFGKEKKSRIILGDELCDEVQRALPVIHQTYSDRIFLVMDSITAILLPEQTEDGPGGFKANIALASFLSRRFPLWTPMFRNYNVLPIFVNQLRQNPMQLFGNPWYSPGGNAQKYYYHARVRVARGKGGKVLGKKKQQVGIQGIITNIKNKSGGLEDSRVAYRIIFDGPTEFFDHQQLKKEE